MNTKEIVEIVREKKASEKNLFRQVGMFPTKSESAIHRLVMLLPDKVPGSGQAGQEFSRSTLSGMRPVCTHTHSTPHPYVFCKCGF